MIGGSGGAKDPYVMPVLLGAQAQTQLLAGRYLKLENKTQLSKSLTGVTIVLICLVSQSNQGNHLYGSYTVLSPNNVINFSPDNGAYYSSNQPLLGATWDSGSAESNYLTRLADKLIASGKCANVVIVPAAVGGTTVQDWATGVCNPLIKSTLSRCLNNGLFEFDHIFVLSHIGESDKTAGTSQANYVARASDAYNQILNFPGFDGKIFITQTSFNGGASPTITAAQASLIDSNNIFFLGNTDAYTGVTYRPDLLHFNQAGSDLITTDFATRIVNYINSL